MKKGKHADVYAASEREHMYALQRWKDKALLPLLTLFMKIGLTPNMLSYSNIFLGVLFVGFIQTSPSISLYLLIIAVAFDLLDGSLARVAGQTTLSGSLVDHFSDLLVIWLTTTGFLLIGLVSGWAAIAYVFAYTTLTALIIVRNMMGIPYKWALRPRLFVYLGFFIYVFWGINWLHQAIALFSIVMLIQVSSGFLVVKREV